MPGLPEGEYLTLFGLYLLKPQVFDYLEDHIQHDIRERGEVPDGASLAAVYRY